LTSDNTYSVVIEKNIPFPARRLSRKGNPFQDILKKLDVGDSFALPAMPRITSSWVRQAKLLGIRIITKRLDDHIRIWRIE